jgi:hypothetical protein
MLLKVGDQGRGEQLEQLGPVVRGESGRVGSALHMTPDSPIASGWLRRRRGWQGTHAEASGHRLTPPDVLGAHWKPSP